MSDLRKLLRRYEASERTSAEAGRALAHAVRERIRYGGRGEASACARELGWDRRRLADWLKRAGRSTSALTEGGGRPTGGKASTGGSDPKSDEPRTERETVTALGTEGT